MAFLFLFLFLSLFPASSVGCSGCLLR